MEVLMSSTSTLWPEHLTILLCALPMLLGSLLVRLFSFFWRTSRPSKRNSSKSSERPSLSNSSLGASSHGRGEDPEISTGDSAVSEIETQPDPVHRTPHEPGDHPPRLR